ncbi:hypothetical protein ABW19_dt0200545 [Dactylella cylindrospora]|nr:hypothetical protein ABW19_dt0200545 [Dactylella cylindrospora]
MKTPLSLAATEESYFGVISALAYNTQSNPWTTREGDFVMPGMIRGWFSSDKNYTTTPTFNTPTLWDVNPRNSSSSSQRIEAEMNCRPQQECRINVLGSEGIGADAKIRFRVSLLDPQDGSKPSTTTCEVDFEADQGIAHRGGGTWIELSGKSGAATAGEGRKVEPSSRGKLKVTSYGNQSSCEGMELIFFAPELTPPAIPNSQCHFCSTTYTQGYSYFELQEFLTNKGRSFTVFSPRNDSDNSGSFSIARDTINKLKVPSANISTLEGYQSLGPYLISERKLLHPKAIKIDGFRKSFFFDKAWLTRALPGNGFQPVISGPLAALDFDLLSRNGTTLLELSKRLKRLFLSQLIYEALTEGIQIQEDEDPRKGQFITTDARGPLVYTSYIMDLHSGEIYNRSMPAFTSSQRYKLTAHNDIGLVISVLLAVDIILALLLLWRSRLRFRPLNLISDPGSISSVVSLTMDSPEVRIAFDGLKLNDLWYAERKFFNIRFTISSGKILLAGCDQGRKSPQSSEPLSPESIQISPTLTVDSSGSLLEDAIDRSPTEHSSCKSPTGPYSLPQILRWRSRGAVVSESDYDGELAGPTRDWTPGAIHRLAIWHYEKGVPGKPAKLFTSGTIRTRYDFPLGQLGVAPTSSANEINSAILKELYTSAKTGWLYESVTGIRRGDFGNDTWIYPLWSVNPKGLQEEGGTPSRLEYNRINRTDAFRASLDCKTVIEWGERQNKKPEEGLEGPEEWERWVKRYEAGFLLNLSTNGSNDQLISELTTKARRSEFLYELRDSPYLLYPGNESDGEEITDQPGRATIQFGIKLPDGRYTSVFAKPYRTQCCTINGIDAEANEKENPVGSQGDNSALNGTRTSKNVNAANRLPVVAYWSRFYSRITKEAAPLVRTPNFVVKWITGDLLQSEYVGPSGSKHLLWTEVPQITVLNCRPRIERAEASIDVSAQGDIINATVFPDTIVEDYNVWNYSSHDLHFQNDTTSGKPVVSIGLGWLFRETLLSSAYAGEISTGKTRPFGLHESLADRVYNIRVREDRLNFDFMSYAIYRLRDSDTQTPLNPSVLAQNASSIFNSAFKAFMRAGSEDCLGAGYGFAPNGSAPSTYGCAFSGSNLATGPDGISYYSVDILVVSKTAAIFCWIILGYLGVAAVGVFLYHKVFLLIPRDVDTLASIIGFVYDSRGLRESCRRLDYLRREQIRIRLARWERWKSGARVLITNPNLALRMTLEWVRKKWVEGGKPQTGRGGFMQMFLNNLIYIFEWPDRLWRRRRYRQGKRYWPDVWFGNSDKPNTIHHQDIRAENIGKRILISCWTWVRKFLVAFGWLVDPDFPEEYYGMGYFYGGSDGTIERYGIEVEPVVRKQNFNVRDTVQTLVKFRSLSVVSDGGISEK